MEENQTTETTEAVQHEPIVSESGSFDFDLKEKPKSSSFYTKSTAYKFMLIFGIAFMCFTFIFQVWLKPIKVVGSSMQPTINASITSEADETHCDIVYYNQADSYSSDEIVIVKNNDYKYVPKSDFQDVKYLIKRVIACPGETITFLLTDETLSPFQKTYFYDIIVKDKNGNTKNIDDSYLKEEMKFSNTEFIEIGNIFPFYNQIFENLVNTSLPLEERQYTYTIPENSYFVMGDNRNSSEDSRYFGVVSYEDISGSVKLHVEYGQNLWEAVWIKLKSII